ncbi:hypothetical protein CJ030_MR2G001911 [Morella rubra]|uniref:Uncharacterized protein n=1 Tax=Morella rubra TaxID=262757 RepID=A0A6A1WCK0_9ROSI|nr:hypothetical protein CJ030_MR2G001911 [Morella rubra]
MDEGFLCRHPRPKTSYFLEVPLTDEQRTSDQDLWTLMMGKTSAVVGNIIKQSVVIGDEKIRKAVMSALNKFTLSKSKGQKGTLTQWFTCKAVAATDTTARPSTDIEKSRSEAPLEMGVLAMPSPKVAQLFTDLNSHVNAIVITALRPLEEHVEKLEREMQWLQEDEEKLWNTFEGECTITMLRNKSIVAHMTLVRE